MSEKPWWQSRAIIGALVAVISGLVSLTGVVLSPEDAQTLETLLLSLGSVVGGLLAIYGRVKAKSTIGSKSE